MAKADGRDPERDAIFLDEVTLLSVVKKRAEKTVDVSPTGRPISSPSGLAIDLLSVTWDVSEPIENPKGIHPLGKHVRALAHRFGSAGDPGDPRRLDW
jgi:hypothetical protein